MDNPKLKNLQIILVILFIGVVAGLDLRLDVKHLSCFESRDGSISINITNGFPPYRIMWPDLKKDTMFVDELPTGNYSVTVTDVTNQMATDYAYVAQPPPLRLIDSSLSTQSVNCFGERNGAVSLLIYGGTPPFYYNWAFYQDEGGSENFTQIFTPKPIIFFEETVGDQISLTSSSPFPVIYNNMDTNSGINSIEVNTGQIITFQCDSCMRSSLYIGIQFWVFGDGQYFDDITVTLDDDDSTSITTPLRKLLTGKNNGARWNQVFIEFMPTITTNYTKLIITNKAPAYNYILIDDVIILPNMAKRDKLEQFRDGDPLPFGIGSAVTGPSGFYIPTITDANQCQYFGLSIEITEPEQLEVAFYDNEDETATIDVIGGVPPYIIRVGDIDTDGDAVKLGPGTHDVYVKDSNNCTYLTQGRISPQYEKLKMQFYIVARVVMAIAATAMLAYTSMGGVFLWKKRANMHPYDPGFCGLIVAGSFISYLSALISSLYISTATCGLLLWFTGFSAVLIYGTMFIKLLLIMRILKNFPKFLSQESDFKYLLKILACAMAIEVGYLVVWTGFDFPTAVEGNFYDTVCYQYLGSVFWAIFLLLNGGMVCAGAFFAFKMKDKFAEFVELKYIGHSFYFMVMVLLVAIPTGFATRSESEFSDILQLTFVCIAPTFPLTTFIGKLITNYMSTVNWKCWRREPKVKGWKELKTVKY